MDLESFRLHQNLFKEEAMRAIANEAQVTSFEAGTQLLVEGKYIKVIPVLISGLLKVTRQENGKELLLYYIRPGESCVMTITSSQTNETSQINAWTEEDSELLLIPSRLFPDWQYRFPSVQQFVLNLYKKKFDDLLKAFNAVAFQKMDERLKSYLTQKAESHRTNVLVFTHQVIADELGLARETVSRMLKKLESDGEIKLGRGSIEIINKN